MCYPNIKKISRSKKMNKDIFIELGLQDRCFYIEKTFLGFFTY